MNEIKKFQGNRFEVYDIEFTLPSGEKGSKQVLRQPNVVTILPLLDAERFVMIQNYRIGVDRTLLELPAGTMEVGETPMQTAARELAEETGYTAGKLELVQRYFVAPGNSDEEMFFFIATDLTKGAPQREPNEQIENQLMAWNQVGPMIAEGSIQDAKTLVGLLLYQKIRAI